MIAFPPKPTSILLRKEEFCENKWVVQPKYRGWRIVIHDNDVFTRHGRKLPIRTDYSCKRFDYQLDGEIINPRRQTEHAVPTAIKGNYAKLLIFDIYVLSEPQMTLDERLRLLDDEFDIHVDNRPIDDYSALEAELTAAIGKGYEGIVIKKRESIYKASKYVSVIDPDWIKIK